MVARVQRGIFSTHRGRLVKRGLLTFAAVAVGMFVLNSVVNGGGGTQVSKSDAAAVESIDQYQVDETPQVASTVANPFRAQSMSFYTSSEGSQSESIEQPTDGSNGDTSTTPSSPDETAQNADSVTVKRTAQSFALAWASWSGASSPEEYVRSLPFVKPGAEATLVAAAKARTGSGSVGSLTGASPIVDSYDGTAGKATVEVSVSEGSLDEGGAAKTVTYTVTLERYLGSDGNQLWGVTSAVAV